MAIGEEKQNKKESKGFAGLSSLVSDIDTTLPPASKQEAVEFGASSSAERPTASENAQLEPSPNNQQPYQAPSQPSSNSSAGKWVLGIAAVFGVLWFIGETNKSPSSPAPAYSPPARNTAPSYSTASAQPQVPSPPEEEKPPVGQGLVFSTAQVRYCLAEDIRIDSAKSALNNYSDSDVDRFNAMVADYNSRCGSFRFRSGALESANRDIEAYRSQLQAEGRSRFARNPSTGALSVPAPSRHVPDATVQAIQRYLNELGYNAGPADGLIGAKTRAAIASFQRDKGISADGVANIELLRQLRSLGPSGSAASRHYNPSSSFQRPAPTETVQITSEERQSIEMVCLSDKVNNGPAAYQRCVDRQVATLGPNNRRPDLSGLSSGERQSIEIVCLSDKVNNGPAAYNKCIGRQVASLGSSSRRPDLSALSSEERQSIEMVCLSDKINNGPAAYNKCLQSHLASLGGTSRRPNLSRLSSGQRQSVELVCLSEKINNGPAAYNQCLTLQLSRMGN